MAIRGNATPVVPLIPQAAMVPTTETDGTSAKALEPIDPGTLEGTIEPLELVKIEPQDVQALFTTDGALKPILEKVAALARSVIQDATTAKGREAIKSLAYKIAQAKTTLEAQGVALNRELKALPAAVDKNKREAKEFLEALQTEIRKPVTEWEAEQARIEAQRKAEEEAAELARQIDTDHEFALLLDKARTHDIAEAARAEKQAQIDNDARVAREAADKEREAAAVREADARAALEKAEHDREEAEQRQKDAEAREAQAKIDAEAARVKAQKDADERAEQAAIEARQKEQERQTAEKKAEDDARAARERDVEHRRTFNREAWADIQAVILTQTDPQDAESMATEIVMAIAKGKVRHVAISY